MDRTLTRSPSVSVVIPTYQRRAWVVRACESALRQTYRDFEVIVVDDGSTDGTLEALAGLDSRVRCVYQDNRGVAAARNAGIHGARGEIIAFLDSDDRWRRDHLSVVTEALALHPETVLVCTCPRERLAGRQRPCDARVVDLLPRALVENHLGYPSGVAVRREALLESGCFDEGLVVLEDGELWLRLAARGPFCFVQHRTVVHQFTEGSLIERGARSGAYIHASERLTETGAALVRRIDRPDRAELARLVEGRRHYVRALRALVDGDEAAVGHELAKACALAPALSSEPEVVAKRISRIGWSREERLRNFAAASLSWPDARSDTAVYLHWRALVLLLRAARLRSALRLACRTQTLALPRFVVRNRSLVRHRARQALDRRLYRGRERVEA